MGGYWIFDVIIGAYLGKNYIEIAFPQYRKTSIQTDCRNNTKEQGQRSLEQSLVGALPYPEGYISRHFMNALSGG